MNKAFTFMRESSTARFLIPVGIIITIFGVFMLIINSNNQNYKKITASVFDVKVLEEAYTDEDGNHVEETYGVSVKYTVEGKEYEATLENVSKHKIGDKMTIYYNPKKPSQVTQTKSLLLPIIIIVAGIASLVGGIISAINAFKKHNKMKEQERSWASGQ